MNIFPIFARELRSESSLRAFRRQRLGVAKVAALAFVVFMLVDRWVGGIRLAFFSALGPFSGILPFTLLIVALNHAGNLLSIERREGTLPLLLLTHLNGYDIAIGKVFQALFLDLVLFLAIVPALTLPLLGIGLSFTEILFLTLAIANVLFFGLAVGLFGAVFGDSRVAASWCLLFLLPFIVSSSPFALLLPTGGVWYWLGQFHWLDPGDAVTHVQTAAAGFRPGTFWSSLIGSHAVAWCFLILAGFFLPRASRWQAAANAGAPVRKKWRPWKSFRFFPPALRTRLLDRNPYLWLTSRDRWAAVQLWLWLLFLTAGWGWLAWFSWALKGLNITLVLVLAAASCWFLILTAVIPGHAGRQLVADRLNGAFELILCTPLSVNEIVRGIWLSLSRRFLAPLIAVILLGITLMTVGYVTYGFGGMLDPQDRPLWLFSWFSGIITLPLLLISLSWVTLRRALFARNIGEAGGVAFLQVFGTIGLVQWILFEIGSPSSPLWSFLVLAVSVAVLAAFSITARRHVLLNLRPSTAVFTEPYPSRFFRLLLSVLPRRTQIPLSPQRERI